MPPVFGGTVIQLSLIPMDQMQFVVTCAEPLPPATGKLILVGVTPKLHTAPACVTVIVAFPILMVPDRESLAGLVCAWKATVPLPDPVCPEYTESQLAAPALTVAAHGHPSGAVTFDCAVFGDTLDAGRLTIDGLTT